MAVEVVAEVEVENKLYMQLYQKVLFIGARGEYLDMPFEILGSGQVGYTVQTVGDHDNSDDIGSTFPAVEYYCLANNGQTWYFAVSDHEVYYCRQLDATQIQQLKDEMSAPDFTVESFLNGSYNASLVEYGSGKLNKAEGRAKRDFREFSEFSYLDFKVGQKSYSLDIFPDEYQEWFETIWVPKSQLTKIFKDSLGLDSPQAKETLKLAQIWKKIGIACFVAAGLIVLTALILAFQTKKVYEQKNQISSEQNSEIVFENIKIDQANKMYNLEVETALPTNQGISLNFSILDDKDNVVSISDQEYVNSSDQNNQKVSSDFYPDKTEVYKLLIKVNDYGQVGSLSTDTTTTETTTESDLPDIPITIRVFKDAISITSWSISAILVSLIGVGCLVYKYNLEGKTWSDFLKKKST